MSSRQCGQHRRGQQGGGTAQHTKSAHHIRKEECLRRVLVRWRASCGSLAHQQEPQEGLQHTAEEAHAASRRQAAGSAVQMQVADGQLVQEQQSHTPEYAFEILDHVEHGPAAAQVSRCRNIISFFLVYIY